MNKEYSADCIQSAELVSDTKRMEKFEQTYLDNSEYDYGHDVRYDSKED
jgi:hypothetical protein